MRVGGAFGLSQNVFHTDTFKNGTHGAACNNSGTFGGRKDEDFCTTETSCLLVRHGSFDDRNFHKVLFGCFYAFGNSCGDFTGFAKTVTNNAFSVTHNYNCSESKRATALGYLNYTIDSNQSIF